MKLKVSDLDTPLTLDEVQSEIGSDWGNPKETWDFLRQGPRKWKPVSIAKRFLKINQSYLKIEGLFDKKNRSLSRLQYVKTIQSLGGYHVIFRQTLGRDRIPLFRGFVTVHMNRKKQVYMCKCRATPTEILQTRIKNKKYWSRYQTRKQVLEWILNENSEGPSADIPFQPPYPVQSENLTYRGDKLYYRYDAVEPYLCRAVRFARIQPKEEWCIHVQVDNRPEAMAFVSAQNDAISHAKPVQEPSVKKAIGYVFNPNPVTALQGHENLIRQSLINPTPKSSRELQSRLRPPPESAYHLVELSDLDDSGYLQGKRVKTITPKGKPRLKRDDGDFRVWARVPGSAHGTGFEEVMAYHHINESLKYLEILGYRGDMNLFQKPLVANIYFSDEDNAWYNNEDQQLYFGTGEISEAEDGETIVHELGHAVLDRICPNFGQTHQSLAMGEGYADYFAMSAFFDHKPGIYKRTVMSWDGLSRGLLNEMLPPAIRSLVSSENLSFDDFVDEPDYHHQNGNIWSAILWDIFEALGQSSPKARMRVDKVIVDSTFEVSPSTTFARGARALIHANRNLFKGEDESAFLKIFQKRKIPGF